MTLDNIYLEGYIRRPSIKQATCQCRVNMSALSERHLHQNLHLNCADIVMRFLTQTKASTNGPRTIKNSAPLDLRGKDPSNRMLRSIRANPEHCCHSGEMDFLAK